MSWNEHYSRLLRIKRKCGHVPTASSLDQARLVEWLEKQKATHTALAAEQIRKLIDADISLGAREDTWYRNYFLLVDFQAEHKTFPTGRHKAARWLEYQRRKHNGGLLPTHQSRLLESIGVCWYISIFEKRLAELKDFHKKNGHTRVPWNHLEHPGLGHYVSNTLRAHKERLTKAQVTVLDSIDFVWDIRESAWQLRYAELKRFIELNGCYPTKRTNAKLAIWVRTQRKNMLNQEKISQLGAVAFTWDPREENWNNKAAELYRFFEQNGHTKIPSNTRKHQSLWRWLNSQKLRWNSLHPHRRITLLKVGVIVK